MVSKYSEKKEIMDLLRNPMRTYMKKGDVSENELNYLKSIAAKIGIDEADFEMRFDMVRSAKKEYYAQSKGKGLFASSSKKFDLFFLSEDEIEDYIEDHILGKLGILGRSDAVSDALEDKIERKIEEELRRPHFDSAFDQAFPASILSQINQEIESNHPQQDTPPPMPMQLQYTLNINGQNCGPYDMQQLQQMVQKGEVTAQTYVWKQGMVNWELAGNVQELSALFGAVPPPPPTM